MQVFDILGGNPDIPFIYVWPNFTINEEDDIKAMIRQVAPRFESFSPLYLNFWLSPDTSLCTLLETKIGSAQRILMKDITENSVSIHHDEDLSLQVISDDSYFLKYEEEYLRFHQDFPELRDWVMMNSFSAMEACRRDRMLYHALKDGRPIGIMAVEEKPLLGKAALYINEIMVYQEFRGRNHAKTMLQLLEERAIASGNHLIWSHIDSRNTASTKTALRYGQKIISNEYFYPISP